MYILRMAAIKSFLVYFTKICLLFLVLPLSMAQALAEDRFYIVGKNELGAFPSADAACAAVMPIAQEVTNSYASEWYQVKFYNPRSVTDYYGTPTTYCQYAFTRSDGWSRPASGALCDETSMSCRVYKESCIDGSVCACFAGLTKDEQGQCVEDTREKGAPPEKCPGLVSSNANSYVGNPINISAANKFQHEVDYNSFSEKFILQRYYNSIDGKWSFSYTSRLRWYEDRIALLMDDGRELNFPPASGTEYSALSEYGVLESKSAHWIYLDRSGQRFKYNDYGRLVQWSSLAGQNLYFDYAPAAQATHTVVTVKDHISTKFSFVVDYQFQPISLSAPGVEITYHYSASPKQLLTVSKATEGIISQRQYHYEDSYSNVLLTGITDERGVRYATWSYDNQGRAISSEHADGAEKVLITYNTDGSSTVTNELGKKATYRFQTIKGVKRITAIEGEPSANCPNSNSTFTYDERGLLKTKTDNKGHLTTFDYNERGLEVSRTEAAGTPQARTITTDWHPTLFLPITVTEPSRITTYTYDDQGRQLSQSVTQR